MNLGSTEDLADCLIGAMEGVAFWKARGVLHPQDEQYCFHQCQERKQQAKACLIELLHRTSVPMRVSCVEPCHAKIISSKRLQKQTLATLKELRYQWDEIKARLSVENQLDANSLEEENKLKAKKRKIKADIKQKMVMLGQDPDDWLSFTGDLNAEA